MNIIDILCGNLMTYVPTARDIEWTGQAIVGKKVWAAPSAGCVFLLDHEAKKFHTIFCYGLTAQEKSNHDRIGINLVMLGFSGKDRVIVEGAKHIDDILEIIWGMNEDEIDNLKKYAWETKPYDERFERI